MVAHLIPQILLRFSTHVHALIRGSHSGVCSYLESARSVRGALHMHTERLAC